MRFPEEILTVRTCMQEDENPEFLTEDVQCQSKSGSSRLKKRVTYGTFVWRESELRLPLRTLRAMPRSGSWVCAKIPSDQLTG